MTERLLESSLRATDEAGLARVDSLLHDETFDLSGIEHDVAAKTLTIPVRRQFHGGPERIMTPALSGKRNEEGLDADAAHDPPRSVMETGA